MIKGINKHIIEINKTNSEYFDKIVLYVKDGKEVYSIRTLKSEAEDYVSRILPKRRDFRITKMLLLKISALGVVILTAILGLLQLI